MTDAITKAVEALDDAKAWHEEQDKALSKQPPSSGPNGTQWARLQHREQIETLSASIAALTALQEQPAPLTVKFDRFNIIGSGQLSSGIVERSDDGDWVRFEDIEPILSALQPSPAPAIVEKLRARMASASINDRRYERPMTWEEADELVAALSALHYPSPTREEAEALVKRLRALTALNKPGNGGPYGGYAAQRCMDEMAAAADFIAREILGEKL